MADTQRLPVNWIEIDRSIIFAIGTMQAARGCFDSNSSSADSCQSRLALSRSLNENCRCSAHQREIREEQVAICFDDAERMLDEVRARIMMARALLSGAPRLDVPARPTFATAAALSAVDPKKPLRRSLSSRCARMAFRMVVRAKRNAARIVSAAILVRRGEKMISAFRHAKSWATGLSGQLQGATQKAFGFRTNGTRQFKEVASVILGAAALSLLSCALLSIWMASGGAIAKQTPPVGNVTSMPSATAAISGCSISGWGKTCYPRRALR